MPGGVCPGHVFDVPARADLRVSGLWSRGAVAELVRGCDAVLALHGATRRRRLADLWEDATADPNHAKNVNCDAVERHAGEQVRPRAHGASHTQSSR